MNQRDQLLMNLVDELSQYPEMGHQPDQWLLFDHFDADIIDKLYETSLKPWTVTLQIEDIDVLIRSDGHVFSERRKVES